MSAAARINLILGSHAHVPFGSDTAEFEKVYANTLRPFVSGLYKFPQIQAALHYSGVLLYWVERSHPEMFMLIEDMVARKQVEMLGGGFYEPLLPVIPQQDRIGQIELLTTYLRRQFGKRPQGCWIPNFAWEQALVNPLAACGMGFTFLGERQFLLAGNNRTAERAAPCICEDQGKLITVFPVLQPAEAAVIPSILLPALQKEFNKRHSAETDFVVSIFPDKINCSGNETAEHAWRLFFEELSSCENYAQTIMPGRLYKNLKDLQKLSFPDSSEKADTVSPRRFIIINPEAGGIYAKMVFTNVLINQLRGDKSRKLSAHEELWKSQDSTLFSSCGSAGLHNHTLRSAAYSALLGAERVSREKGKFSPSLVPYDFNMDGSQEWLFQDARINCYVQSTGGGIFELDYLPKVWNYLDTCGSRQAFTDRLLPVTCKGENVQYDAIDGARLCGIERYEAVELDKTRRRLRLALRRAAPDRDFSLPFGSIEIEKIFSLKKDSVFVSYTLINSGTEKETFQFAPEIDLSLPGEGKNITRFFACKTDPADPSAMTAAPLTQAFVRGADGLKIHDLKNEIQITLTANRPFDAKILPIYLPDETDGAELFQAYCIMPLLPVPLEPGEKWDMEFTLKFTH